MCAMRIKLLVLYFPTYYHTVRSHWASILPRVILVSQQHRLLLHRFIFSFGWIDKIVRFMFIVMSSFPLAVPNSAHSTKEKKMWRKCRVLYETDME